MAGIYIHIPFCGKKCPYCDFYSVTPSKSKMEQYTTAVIAQMEQYRDKGVQGETLYFGGGTPNLMGSENICRLIDTAKEIFSIKDTAEITVEANPATVKEEFLLEIKRHGTNRLSLGMQSSNVDELKSLGRRHTPDDVIKAVNTVRKVGFDNISLDLMLGVPDQTMESIKQSIQFCADLNVEHISAYMLKIEEGTPFFENAERLNLPDDDYVSDMYITAVDELEKHGFIQYEVSNFARKGFEAKHNTIYWLCGEYLGFGAAAHSFFGGERFFYPRSADEIIAGTEPIYDGKGGSREEYLMLRMRLKQGLSNKIWREKYNEDLPPSLIKKAREYERAGLIEFKDDSSISFTKQGYLVSNTIILSLIDEI